VKVATLNLNGLADKHGPWPLRRHRIADVLRKENPEVIALQAVTTVERGEVSQAHELAAELGGALHVRVHDGNAPGRLGLAWISRAPILDFEVLVLGRRPGTEDAAERAVLRARVESRLGSLELFNVHASWVPEQTQDNLRELLSWSARCSGARLAVGDFNTEPHAPVLDAMRGAGWIDVWHALRAGDPGFTFEADRPSLRIDYVWADPRLCLRASDIRVVGASEGPVRLSDHLALVVTFA
jgi:endonuclease/exonuclease/phosphatase family metal-dependent hydrolase